MTEIHTDNPFGRVSRIALSASNRNGRTILDDVSFTCCAFIGIFLEVGLKPLCNGSFRQLPMLPF